MPGVTFVCTCCGSRNVMRDAWAVWDEGTQHWELGSVFDAAFCADCDGETTLKEQPTGGDEK